MYSPMILPAPEVQRAARLVVQFGVELKGHILDGGAVYKHLVRCLAVRHFGANLVGLQTCNDVHNVLRVYRSKNCGHFFTFFPYALSLE